VKTLLAFVSLMLLSMSLSASEMSGTFEEHPDRSFNVNVSDGYHELYGWADEFDDDTLYVHVKNNRGDEYVGKARRGLHGGYSLDLHNEATGEVVTGYIDNKN
jgi:hypothetical protein